MKKTKLILAALICAVSVLVTSCESTPVETETENTESVSMFVQVEKAGAWRIVYHRDTKVMYAVSLSSYNRGNFTVLVNPDGSPMLWEGE